MSKTIGIDLGTVYSCVASMIDGKGVVIPDEDGHHTQPSVFAINNNQEVLIGRRAIAQHNSNPLGTIFAVKRLIGLKYDSPEIEVARQKLPYRILRAANGDAWVEVNGKPISPEEISGQIILRMKQIAERYFGEKVFRAVITVPAHFNDSQRQATRDAGRIAGLDVMRIINEPTAASLAFGMDKSLHSGKSIQDIQERTIAVFDLGGGTFDVSILEMRRGTFIVKSTHGDCYLGGEDIDNCIVNFLVEVAKATLNVDLQRDKLAMQRIKVAAQDAKHKLSAVFEVTIELPYIARGMKNLVVRLNRDMLEKLVEPVLQRLEIPCLAAIEDANISPKQITDVVLVGGQTRMPAVKNYCRRIFGSVPRDDIDPDEAVAVGAAIQAALLDGLLDGVRFEDVLPLSLGIEIQGGLTQPIIPRNTKVPVQVTKIFTTTTPNQERVTIHVLQGESKFAPNNETMGRFELSDIPPQPRGYPEIAVSFAVDAGGMISVTAQDLDTGEEKHCQIVASSGLDDSELEELLRASRLREEQEDRKRYMESEDYAYAEPTLTSSDLSLEKEKLKSLLYHTQFVLDAQGDSYKGAARITLEQILKESRDYLETTPTRETLLMYIDDLKAEADKLSEFLAKPW